MKRGSPESMDKTAEVNTSSFVGLSLDDRPPVPAAGLKKKRELQHTVTPLNFSFLPSNELDRSRTSPGIRSPGLTTNRSGKIVHSGTIHRTTNMKSLARNKSSDPLVQPASSLSGQSSAARSETTSKIGADNGQKGAFNGCDAGTRRVATLDRSWRTKEADLRENLPHVGATSFSFDLERDAQDLLDMISDIEEIGAGNKRLNSAPSTPEFDQMTVIRRIPGQKASFGCSLGVGPQGVACDVPSFNDKSALPTKSAMEIPAFNKTSIGNTIRPPDYADVSAKLQRVDIGLQELHEAHHKAAIEASKVQLTPGRSRESPNGITEIDQASGYSRKFSATNDDPPSYPTGYLSGHHPGYRPLRNGTINGTMLPLSEAGNNGDLYDRRGTVTPAVHMGVSAQRGYASDSEDPMDWLEQQRAKLKLKQRCREGPTKLDPRLLQELKIRQRILGRGPVDEKESLECLLSSGAGHDSKIAATSPGPCYNFEYGQTIPPTSLSNSYMPRNNYDQIVGETEKTVATPGFDQNRGGHFAKETQLFSHENRSLPFSSHANVVPVSKVRSFSSSACETLSPRRTAAINSESVNGTNIRSAPSSSSASSADQREIHETCVSKKVIHQNRGYSPTRLDALIEAVALTADCESSPTSSRSTDISDSGYRTASASSTNDESPLNKTTGQQILNSRVQEVPTTGNSQAEVEVSMALPQFRQLVSADDSSKINGSTSKQPSFPVTDAKQLAATSQHLPTFAGSSRASGNAFEHSRPRTLEEEIEDLLALGSELELKQRVGGHAPLQEHRGTFVEPQEPFIIADALKSRPAFYQNAINLTEEQRQMQRLTGAQKPTGGMANHTPCPRQPINGNLSVGQPVRTINIDGLPTETRLFNQLHVNTYQPNRAAVQPSYQRTEPQSTNGGGQFHQDLDKPSGSRDQKDLFVRLPASTYNHTLPNHVTRHETVDQSRRPEQPIAVSQQFPGEWNTIGHWNAGMDKYAQSGQAERVQPSGTPGSATSVQNHTMDSRQGFQRRLITGSDSAIGHNGLEYQRSARSVDEPWTGDGTQKCIILYSADGQQVLIPKSYLDSTSTSMVTSQSTSSLRGVPQDRQVENVSSRVATAVAPNSRIVQQQTGQMVNSPGGEGQTIDRYIASPEFYTNQQRVPAGLAPQLQQPVGGARMENVRPLGLQAAVQSPNDALQGRPFYSQISDSVFGSPPPAAVSMNQVVAHLRGEVSRTSSFSSSVTGQSSPSLSVDRSSGGSVSSTKVAEGVVEVSPQYVMNCVREAYKEWYKPEMARDDVVNFLKDKLPGSFIIRNSTTYVGDFALAVKVSEIPVQAQPRTGEKPEEEELVRHFLIESRPSGIRLKGRSNEPVFASLLSFVFQHALTPLSLPHRLLLPRSSESNSVGCGTGSISRSSTGTSTSKPQEEISSLLIYIGSVDLETLTGPEALEKAISQIETQKTSPAVTTIVNFILSSQGIVLTDTKRKLFFRRHYPLSCISYCGVDRAERRWTEDVVSSKMNTERRIFGFVSRKRGSSSAGSQTIPDGNECHLFADYETGYPASSVVDLISKTLGENGYNVMK